MLSGVDEKLIEDNVKLVPYMIKQLGAKYNMGIFEYEELYQQGLIGLAKAANSFTEDKNFKFSTYACTCIRNSILIYMRNSTRNKLPLSGSMDDAISNTESLHMEDMVHDSFNVDDFLELKELIAELEVFTSVDAVRTYCMHNLEGYTYKEIREIQGISLYRLRRNLARVKIAIDYIKQRDEYFT